MLDLSLSGVHDAEEITLGIREDREILPGLTLSIERRPKLEELLPVRILWL